ncbi:hypothetical protein FXO37_32890 [Capsicum annuum]|nr:hypothetical protein FXO37_32890 [Capsicum annuum]
MVTFFSARPGAAMPPTLVLIEPNVKWLSNSRSLRILSGEFPDFLPKQVEDIKDTYARKLASRIERIPFSNTTIERSVSEFRLEFRSLIFEIQTVTHEVEDRED